MNKSNILQGLKDRLDLFEPDTSEFKRLFNSVNPEDVQKGREIGNQTEKFMVDLEAFIKVEFGKDSDYINEFKEINFLPTKTEKALNSDRLDELNDYKWKSAIGRLRLLFMKMEAEIKLEHTLTPSTDLKLSNPSKFEMVTEFLRKYGLSGPFFTLAITGSFFLGRWIEQNSIHQEKQEIQAKYDRLNQDNLTLMARIDSLTECCKNQPAEHSDNQPTNKGQ